MAAAGVNVNQQGASYIIGKDDTTYYAIKASTGAILSSSATFTTVLDAVVAALKTAGGGTVFFKKATYVVATQPSMVILVNISFIGEDGAIIQAGAGLNTSHFYVNNWNGGVIENLIFDGNKANQASGTGRAVYGSNWRNVTVRRCTIKDAYTTGFELAATTADGLYNIHVEDCDITGNNSGGVLIGANALGYAYDIWVQGNRVVGNGVANNSTSGIYIGTFITDFDISGNTVRTHGQATDDLNCGIRTNIGGTVSDARATIIGNRCSGIKGQGILVQHTANATIMGNVCNSNDNVGIYVEAFGRSTISGNTCNSNGTWGIDAASYGADFPDKSKIVGNYCSNNTREGIITDSDYITISDNTCMNNAQTPHATDAWRDSGMTVYGDYCTIQGNICGDNQGTKTQKYGLNDYIAGGTLGTYCFITNNDFRNNDVAGMYKGGTAQIVRHNLGWVTENSGTSTGTGAQQTIAHGLSATPTRVILSESTTGGALAYQSAAADATNIYVTATVDKTWQWEAKVR